MQGKILITGGSGFVGQFLAKTLPAAHCNIRIALRYPNHLALKQDNVERVFVDDLSEKTNWKQALSNCDYVVHTAGRAHVMKESIVNPMLEYQKVNIDERWL